MKQFKNMWPVIAVSFLVITTAITSCGKDDPTPPPPAPKTTITSISPTSGYGGDTITITGTNFTGATAVSFGGTAAASFNVVSATTITAVVGTGASGSVSVTATAGTATLAGFTFNSGLPPVDGYSSSNEVEPESLIGYWPFDGNTTESKHTATPVLMGGTQTFVTGKIGQAVQMTNGWLTYGPEATSASEDNTTFNSNDTLQNGFTLSMWTQAAQTETLTNIFQLSTPNIPNWPILGLAFRKHVDNSFDIDAGIANVDGTGPHVTYADAFKEPAFMDTASWAFLTMTYDPTDRSLKYYANGELTNTIILTSLGSNPFPDANSALLMIAPNYATIGSFEGVEGAIPHTPGSSNAIPGFMSPGMNGVIDDIRFFNTTLTDQKINDLFILGSQGR